MRDLVEFARRQPALFAVACGLLALAFGAAFGIVMRLVL
jgi:hypothetical protein